MVISIDGPAGAGKSTVAKKIARQLGMFYLDTGSMYRAFTLYVLNKNVKLDDTKSIESSLEDFHLAITQDGVWIDNQNVIKEIRSESVNDNVSHISSLPFVRKKMVELQRQIGENRDIVVEGRDIGTVVFPNANFKFYLDASVEERAWRRIKDEKNQNKTIQLGEMMDKIKKRDNYDSTRELAPLSKAGDAYYIDSTRMTIEEVCNYIIRLVKENNPGATLYGESQEL